MVAAELCGRPASGAFRTRSVSAASRPDGGCNVRFL